MSNKAKLAITTLNQWVLDFEGNYSRIVQSILIAKKGGARYRLGGELEITGYGCEDHFFENDTVLHSWQVLQKLLVIPEIENMICDVGMPVIHNGTRYNCRVIFTYKKIILIRPKLSCCNQGNYRELRWFTPWFKRQTVEDFILPEFINTITNQISVKIGDAIIQLKDTKIGIEICEELWTVDSPHVQQSLNGVEIFANSSASHFNLRKLNERLQLSQSATSKVGGVYLYNNLIGCDGGRIYYDGASNVCVNGQLVSQSSQFSLKEVQVEIVTVDLSDVRSYRGENSSRAISSSLVTEYPCIKLTDFTMCISEEQAFFSSVNSIIKKPKILTAEQEIEFGGACWLWDYLRRSGLSGFFLPLSGGIDSSSVACLVYSMCTLVYKEIEDGNIQVLADVRRIVKDENYEIESAENFCNEVLTTCYMASENSSEETRSRAEILSTRINSNHLNVTIDLIVSAFLNIFTKLTGLIPKFKSRGGNNIQNLSLQNIQARVRMVLSYLLAQLLQWSRGKDGSLLVLSSSNVDECLRGYYTKYDCSSGDINPIGGINKADLKKFVTHFINKYNAESLCSIVSSPPTAELEPLSDGKIAQTDEQDMGMTYKQLEDFGKLRKLEKCGPYSMFRKLLDKWKNVFSPSEIATKVKYFFFTYSINRHKTTTLTPSLHAENYSPEDNRFDLRPFLYPKFNWQYKKISEDVQKIEELEKNK